MSAIDTIKHARIGIFYGLPVYQALESGRIGHRNPQDGHKMPPQSEVWNLEKDTILVGGGSGEHPAVAFHDIEHAVARYLVFCSPSALQELPEIASKAAAIQGSLQTIQYCDWSNEHHAGFRRRCEFDFSFHSSRLSFEAWLLLNVGEFVFHVMPSFSRNILEWRSRVGASAGILFAGIAIPYGEYNGNGTDRFKIVDSFSLDSRSA